MPIEPHRRARRASRPAGAAESSPDRVRALLTLSPGGSRRSASFGAWFPADRATFVRAPFALPPSLRRAPSPTADTAIASESDSEPEADRLGTPAIDAVQPPRSADHRDGSSLGAAAARPVPPSPLASPGEAVGQAYLVAGSPARAAAPQAAGPGTDRAAAYRAAVAVGLGMAMAAVAIASAAAAAGHAAAAAGPWTRWGALAGVAAIPVALRASERHRERSVPARAATALVRACALGAAAGLSGPHYALASPAAAGAAVLTALAAAVAPTLVAACFESLRIPAWSRYDAAIAGLLRPTVVGGGVLFTAVQWALLPAATPWAAACLAGLGLLQLHHAAHARWRLAYEDLWAAAYAPGPQDASDGRWPVRTALEAGEDASAAAAFALACAGTSVARGGFWLAAPLWPALAPAIDWLVQRKR